MYAAPTQPPKATHALTAPKVKTPAFPTLAFYGVTAQAAQGQAPATARLGSLHGANSIVSSTRQGVVGQQQAKPLPRQPQPQLLPQAPASPVRPAGRAMPQRNARKQAEDKVCGRCGGLGAGGGGAGERGGWACCVWTARRSGVRSGGWGATGDSRG